MTDDTDNDGIDSYADYRERINLMADVIEDVLDDELTEDEDPDDLLNELVFEQVDSSRMCFVTSESLAALKHSDNGPTEWKHLDSDGDSWQQVITAMAFDAVRADLWEKLYQRGY